MSVRDEHLTISFSSRLLGWFSIGQVLDHLGLERFQEITGILICSLMFCFDLSSLTQRAKLRKIREGHPLEEVSASTLQPWLLPLLRPASSNRCPISSQRSPPQAYLLLLRPTLSAPLGLKRQVLFIMNTSDQRTP
jgi:hypothetical protein